MFIGRLKQRLRDMGTLKALCQGAERHARQDGQDKPGAEHFLLSALDLPDGSARRAFTRAQADADQLREAIARQYQSALESIGFDGDSLAAVHADMSAPITATRLLYQAQPSGQKVIQELVEQRKLDKDTPLLGAHVVLAITTLKHGVTPRSLATLGVDIEALRSAAHVEVLPAHRH